MLRARFLHSLEQKTTVQQFWNTYNIIYIIVLVESWEFSMDSSLYTELQRDNVMRFSNFGPNNCMEEEKVVFKKLPLIFFRDDTVFVKMWFRMDKLGLHSRWRGRKMYTT